MQVSSAPWRLQILPALRCTGCFCQHQNCIYHAAAKPLHHLPEHDLYASCDTQLGQFWPFACRQLDYKLQCLLLQFTILRNFICRAVSAISKDQRYKYTSQHPNQSCYTSYYGIKRVYVQPQWHILCYKVCWKLLLRINMYIYKGILRCVLQLRVIHLPRLILNCLVTLVSLHLWSLILLNTMQLIDNRQKKDQANTLNTLLHFVYFLICSNVYDI